MAHAPHEQVEGKTSGRVEAEDQEVPTGEAVEGAARSTEERPQKRDRSASRDDERLVASLRKTAVTSAVGALSPVVQDAVTRGAVNAAKRLPEMLEEAGGVRGVAGLARERLAAQSGRFDSLRGSARGVLARGGGSPEEAAGPSELQRRGRMPLQETIDVVTPLSDAFDEFTNFDQWSRFMHGFEPSEGSGGSQAGPGSRRWHLRRHWDIQIVDRRPDEHIAWRSAGGLSVSGVATFQELAPRLTRVDVAVSFDPQRLLEKMGRGWRFARRAFREDLHRFKAYVERLDDGDGQRRGRGKEQELVEAASDIRRTADPPARAKRRRPETSGGASREARESSSRARGSSSAARGRSSATRRAASSSRPQKQAPR